MMSLKGKKEVIASVRRQLAILCDNFIIEKNKGILSLFS
jgi:hypothetical protein